MISHLQGTISKGMPGEVTVDIGGVGYRVSVPVQTWDVVQDGQRVLLWISTYVREDRFDLFGFVDKTTRTLFEGLLERQGIGPRLGIELCSVPRELLAKAIYEEDAALLQSIKGIGKKTAEKLLLELKSLADKYPGAFTSESEGQHTSFPDQDTIAALQQLGYQMPDIIRTIKHLPKELTSTEERVTAALRSL